MRAVSSATCWRVVTMREPDQPRPAPASHRLPLSLRIAGRLARSAEIDAQLRLAARMGARLDRDVFYRTSESIKLKVDPQDPFQVAMAMGLYSRHATWTMRRFVRPGSVAIDAGAHLGYFSLFLGRLVGPTGQVHAFEPDPRLYSRLAAHVAANGSLTSRPTNVGCWTARQMRRASGCTLSWDGRASMVSSDSPEDAIAVPATTIDTYVERAGSIRRGSRSSRSTWRAQSHRFCSGLSRTLAAAPSAALLIEWVPERFPASGRSPGRGRLAPPESWPCSLRAGVAPTPTPVQARPGIRPGDRSRPAVHASGGRSLATPQSTV